MLSIIVLVSFLLQITSSFDIYDDDNHQLQHVDRTGGFLNLADDRKQPNILLPYSLLDGKLFRLPQTIIPYPRAGRMIGDPDSIDYDLSPLPEFSWTNYEYPFAFLDNNAVSGKKRASIAFPPRIGRKKRSVTDEQSEQEGENKSSQKNDALNGRYGMFEPEWADFEEVDPNHFLRSERRPSGRSKNAFVPRVGKKSFGSILDEVEKRALAFTPRIGRASLIPRIGRNDPRFKVKSRGSFIPRIGRRAAFTPRIGRSDDHLSNKRKIQ